MKESRLTKSLATLESPACPPSSVHGLLIITKHCLSAFCCSGQSMATQRIIVNFMHAIDRAHDFIFDVKVTAEFKPSIEPVYFKAELACLDWYGLSFPLETSRLGVESGASCAHKIKRVFSFGTNTKTASHIFRVWKDFGRDRCHKYGLKISEGPNESFFKIHVAEVMFR